MRWSDQKAETFHAKLLKAVDSSRIFPIGCGVDVHAFEALSFGEQCILAGYFAKPSIRKSRQPVPYHLAFRAMLMDAMKHSKDAELH